EPVECVHRPREPRGRSPPGSAPWSGQRRSELVSVPKRYGLPITKDHEARDSARISFRTVVHGYDRPSRGQRGASAGVVGGGGALGSSPTRESGARSAADWGRGHRSRTGGGGEEAEARGRA